MRTTPFRQHGDQTYLLHVDFWAIMFKDIAQVLKYYHFLATTPPIKWFFSGLHACRSKIIYTSSQFKASMGFLRQTFYCLSFP